MGNGGRRPRYGYFTTNLHELIRKRISCCVFKQVAHPTVDWVVMGTEKFVRLDDYCEYSVGEMVERAGLFRADMQRRRSVREFSNREVSRGVIEDCVLTGGSAPSGANMQPWRFVVVGDAGVKQRIREAAEKEEYEF